eukprot:TRINITY_DN1475_c0_g3_i1.p1 TRINITY_DN1475_c0_g3~~TRINITY_DN1475_c0_g3_i1.p1  ORF type:complete len:314 (-),score=34.07 TRINITY_DN1475_c0_g3_i1:609-1454(-)
MAYKSAYPELPVIVEIPKFEDENISLAGMDFKEALLYKPYNPQGMLHAIIPWVIREPTVPINDSCVIPPYRESVVVTRNTGVGTTLGMNCSKYPLIFSGEMYNSPKKIVHMINFGFDVDVLEIHLNEVYDVVDRFVIAESTMAHSGLKKPLIWELVKDQERFSKFSSKIIHVVVDEKNITYNGAFFDREISQTAVRWKKFLEWNEVHQEFADDDIAGFGDADEIASREVMSFMKHCQLKDKDQSIDVGSMFYMGRLDYAFRSDFPVRDFPYTIGMYSCFTQ